MFTENKIEEMAETFKNLIRELNKKSGTISSAAEAKNIANQFMVTKLPELMRTILNNASVQQDKKTCPHCDGKLKLVSRRSKEMFSRFGKINVTEKYYNCHICKKSGFFNDKDELSQVVSCQLCLLSS